MSRRHRDPYVAGLEQPVLLVPADLALLLWPAVERWVVEHERMGATGKLEAAAPLLKRWSTVVDLYRLGRFADEPRPANHAPAPRQSQSMSYVTADQAADELDCTPQHVTRMARRGDLDGARKVGRDWQIPPEAVAVLKRNGEGTNA